MRFDQLSEANPETLAVGCPFCMTQMEDAMKARSMEEKCACATFRSRPRTPPGQPRANKKDASGHRVRMLC